jgi:1-acyl-sn-glycerol-3-phosphate acyltransferase
VPAILDRIWRSFGTGLFLAVIGVGGSALAISVFPLIALFVRDAERRRLRIQWVLHKSFQIYCRAIHLLRIADVRLDGVEKLQGLTGTLVIANHPSLLDVVMIMAAIPNVQCVVKGGLWRNPFFRLTVEGAGYIRNDIDPEALIDACVATLAAGNNLIIFPEGTRTVRGRPMRFQRGFANIALRAKANLQLIEMSVEPPLLHKGNPWWNVPPIRTIFTMTVRDHLDISPFLGYRFRSIAVRALIGMLETYYGGKQGHGQAGPGSRIEGTDRFGAEAGGSVAR